MSKIKITESQAKRLGLLKEENLFTIPPKVAFKIHSILSNSPEFSEEFKQEIRSNFSESSFWSFLDKNLK